MLIAMQTPSGSTSTTTDVLIWVGVLIIAVLVLGIVIVVIRKRVLARENAASDGFIEQLRQMHKRGELSTPEYEAARKSLTSTLAARMEATSASATPSKALRTSRTASPPAAPRNTNGPQELRARPGFDLTGARLPKPPAPPPPPPSAPPSQGPYDRKPPA